MPDFFRTHPKTKWAAISVGGLVAAVCLFALLFDWNLLRAPLARKLTAATGRPSFIDGDLKVHLLSWDPRAEIDGLRIENPPWADSKVMFGARRLVVSVSLLRLLRGQIVLPLVDLVGPTINLERDSRGRASWELGTRSGTPNHDTTPVKLPTIQRLVIEDGKLHVVDEVRKLMFGGSLVAGERPGQQNESAFRIRCSGALNAKPFKLEANGGPLLNLEPSRPYSFTTHVVASDIKLDTHVTVRKPFDLGALDIRFVVSGDDLADAYYLTGLALPNTPNYRLGATVRVDGTRFKVDDLTGRLGSSDLSGDVAVDAGGEKPKLTAHLKSKLLDIVDLAPTLGNRAPKADRLSTTDTAVDDSSVAVHGAPPPATAKNAKPAEPNGGLLLPDADLQVKRVRGMNADVSYRAEAVKAPKVPMRDVNLHLILADGLLSLDPLSFGLQQGRLTGRVQIDARGNDPVTDVDMHIDGVNLAEFRSAAMKQAPLAGVVMGRFKFHGTGTSVHKFAAASDGAVSVVIPHGEINEAIAELTGINVLQGLGLLIAKGQKQTDIRCGILDFKDHAGNLDTTTVYVDTSNVLITGRGDIDLHDEDINLALQGDPKHVRLVRLRSPIELDGTLLHPKVGLKASKLAEQAGVAAALGVLLTPAAAALAFIDPGLAKNKDCSTVLAQAKAGVRDAAEGAPRPGAPPPPGSGT